jgi:SAM-dependent methyltransferase
VLVMPPGNWDGTLRSWPIQKDMTMNMHEAYEYYFRTRYYDQRYPRPNQLTLERVLGIATPGATLLDIGAGNGRYAIPLARCGYQIVAVEPCDAARDQLAQAADALSLSARIQCFKTFADVDDELIQSSSLALFLFGVLGHMRFEERQLTLRRLKEGMRYPAEAIGSVPNRKRRFRDEQRHRAVDDDCSAPRFSYSRRFGGASNTFEYSAFSPSEFREEIASAGWTCVNICAESVLHESTVTRRRLLGSWDAQVSRLVPAQLGYDMLFHIRTVSSLVAAGLPERWTQARA